MTLPISNQQSPIRNHNFSLLVKPASADCNLRCAYCFYLDRCGLYPATKRHRMSDNVLERMISSFMRTEQAQYAFGWQGGEPTLMGTDFFKRVTSLQEKHGRSGSVVSNGLQTNATMIDDDLAEHLARYRFLVGVSLDGPADIHDRYRKHPGGIGSHAEVMRGIANLRRHGVEFNILALVNDMNVRRGREIYRYFRDNNFLFHQYIECVEFDPYGKPMPFAVSGEAWGDFSCEIYDEWVKSDTRIVSVRLFDSILAMLVDEVANVCKLGRDCRQYFVVEHNGDVYPCDFFVEHELRLGNVAGGDWDDFLDSPVYAEFGQLKSEWHVRCENCEYLRFCAGDCLKNRFSGVKNPRKLSALCRGWKQFFKHAMPGFRRLADEIRRDRIKYAADAGCYSTIGNRPSVTGNRNLQNHIGRNDPCPCGSGKKHKKCHGAISTEAKRSGL